MVKLVPYWKKWHKFASIRLCAIAVACKTGWVYLPPNLTNAIPSTAREILAWGIFVLISVSTLVSQKSVINRPDGETDATN